jgi:hypothetical protein
MESCKRTNIHFQILKKKTVRQKNILKTKKESYKSNTILKKSQNEDDVMTLSSKNLSTELGSYGNIVDLSDYENENYFHRWQRFDDLKLTELVEKYGYEWDEIKQSFPGKTDQELRNKYFNKLDPRLNKAKFTKEEDDLIIKLHRRYGNRWSEIAKYFSKRNSYMIKNRFYSKLKLMPKSDMDMGMTNVTMTQFKKERKSSFQDENLNLNYPKVLSIVSDDNENKHKNFKNENDIFQNIFKKNEKTEDFEIEKDFYNIMNYNSNIHFSNTTPLNLNNYEQLMGKIGESIGQIKAKTSTDSLKSKQII